MDKRKVASQLGVMAAAAAAAGYYFYASKDAAQNRKVASKWANDFKADVMKRAKKLKKVDQAALLGVIAETTRTFEGMKNIDKKNLARAAKELKSNWRKVMGEMEKGAATGNKIAKKAVKSTVKEARTTAKKIVKSVKKQIKK